jgi:hypothetical protein
VKDNTDDGINLETATLTIKNSLIYGNDAGITMVPSTLTVRNCTIVDNDNYGIKNEYGCSENIFNCILWNNSDDLYDCEATYSCIEDGDGGTGNISSDPCFVPSDELYHLQSSSLCIDVGKSSATYTGQVDIDGDERVIDVVGKGDGTVDVDMGSDEYDPGS